MSRNAPRALCGAALVLASCQSYNAYPQAPANVEVQDDSTLVAGHAPSPNIMFLIDRSGSMVDSASGLPNVCTGTGLPYGGRGATMSGQTCKWNDLLDTLLGPQGSVDAGFIAALDAEFAPNAATGDPIRLGLTYFGGYSSTYNGSSPIANDCAPGTIAVGINPGTESQITTTLLGLVPAGGTPTAASLAELGASGVFPTPVMGAKVQRANYVIIITDGAPNCDSDFQATAANCTDDQCTLGPGSADPCPMADWGVPGDGTGGTCACWEAAGGDQVIPEGCLDGDATVSAVQALANITPPINTFVIGYGSEAVSPHAVAALNGMGKAGGEAPDGGGNSYYQASSTADVQAALNAILGQIAKPCSYQLAAAPVSPSLIEVIVTPSDGTAQTLTSSQWTYSTAPPTVLIQDKGVCNEIKASTLNDPITVDIRYASP